MTPNGEGLRYAYIKNGDVVEQIQRILPEVKQHPNCGPDAFLASFLQMAGSNDVLLLSYSHRDNYLKVDNIEAIAYACVTKGIKPVRIVISFIKRLRSFVMVLFRLVRFRPDRIICGRQGFMLWAAYIVSLISTIPVVHSRHASVTPEGFSLIQRMGITIDNWVISRIAGAVCHGPFTKQQLRTEGIPGSKIFEFDVSFHTLVNAAQNRPSIHNISKNGTYDVILYVGRITREKGVFDLLNASSELLHRNTHINLVYVGEGKDLDDLKEQIRQEQLTDRVITLGNVQHDDLGGIYLQSEILVTPTQHAKEARCMTAMEGLVMGVPVIAPEGGAFPYLVKDNYNGLLYEVDSVSDLQKKLSLVLESSDLYENLKNGAIESGQNLIEAEYTFAEAVSRAFSDGANYGRL